MKNMYLKAIKQLNKVCITIILILLQSFSPNLMGQTNPGAKQLGMSNSDIALSNDVFTIFNNPAGLSQMNWREVGFFYSPAPFGLKQLSSGFLAYHEPTSFGSLGLGLMTYGFELYRENKLTLTYSNSLDKKYFIGTNVNLHSLTIKNYGSDFIYSLDLGALIYFTDDLRWGVFVKNLNRATWQNDSEPIPVVFKSGFSYDLIRSFSLNVNIEKELLFDPNINFGLNYDLLDFISIRTGFSTFPSRFSAGVGFYYKNFQFDYAMNHHQVLGFTHQFGLLISLGKNEGNRTDRIKKYLGNE